MCGYLSRLDQGSTGPRLDGMSISGSVEFWTGDSPSVSRAHSKPSCNTGGRSDGGCVTSEWPLERQGGCSGWCEGGVCRGRRAGQGDGWIGRLAQMAKPGRWDEWTGNAIASKPNWNWIWDWIALQLLLGLGGPSLGLGVGSVQCTRRDRGAGEEEHGWWTAGDQTQHERKHRGCTGPEGRYRGHGGPL